MVFKNDTTEKKEKQKSSSLSSDPQIPNPSPKVATVDKVSCIWVQWGEKKKLRMYPF